MAVTQAVNTSSKVGMPPQDIGAESSVLGAKKIGTES